MRNVEFRSRNARSTSAQVNSFKRPFSIFDYLESNFAKVPALHRILSQGRQHDAKTIVTEGLEPSEDLIQENEDLKIRCAPCTSHQSRTWRISLFSEAFSSQSEIERISPESFLGYAIIKEDILDGKRICRIYESVIRPSRHPNNCIRGAQKWDCSVLSITFSVLGYLYAQQNGLTNVCAHAAARTVASRFHPQGDMTYREMNDLVGIDHKNRRLGDGAGLNTKDLQAILEKAGASCVMINYQDWGESDETVTSFMSMKEKTPYQKVIYPSIESGFPALLAFQTKNSDRLLGIAVFGHTFNEDAWVSQADFGYFRVGDEISYIPSDYWVSMFLIHDDNFGSNYCLPKFYLETKGQDQVFAAFATLPKEVQLPGLLAEIIAADYLYPLTDQAPKVEIPWMRRLRSYQNKNRLVLRPYLVSFGDYVCHLESLSDWEGNSETSAIESLRRTSDEIKKRMFWMVEMSVPELFHVNRRKLGEVLLRADIAPSPERDLTSFAFARLPGQFAFPRDRRKKEFFFPPSGIKGHTALYGCEDS